MLLSIDIAYVEFAAIHEHTQQALGGRLVLATWSTKFVKSICFDDLDGWLALLLAREG